MDDTTLEEDVLSLNRKLTLLYLKATTTEQRELQELVTRTNALAQLVKEWGGCHGTSEDDI